MSQEKVEENRKDLETHISNLIALANTREDASISKEHGSGELLSARIESPQCKVSGLSQVSGERDSVDCDEVVSSTTVKLPFMEKIPPYTTWIFLDKYALRFCVSVLWL